MSPAAETVVLHGRRLAFRRAAPPPASTRARRPRPAILLVHGIAGTAAGWDAVVPALAARYDVIAPDLPGHGGSDAPVGDYSTGAYACALRDLLDVLDVDTVTIAGHSLGGGIAMQFAYQFPERVERMVLVASGGLGREVSPLVRAAALPGSQLVVPLLASAPARAAGRVAGTALRTLGRQPGTDTREAARSLASLHDGHARRAFLGTVRALVDPFGQRVSATDRLYLAEDIPTLVLWGARDSIIPVAHGRAAVRAMPGSRLEVFEGAGHFPHVDEPERFAGVVDTFVRGAKAATYDRARLRGRLGAPGA